MTGDRLALIATGAVFTVIGATVVALRLAALAKRTRSIGADDWSILLAWISSIGFTIASYVSVRWGVGLNMLDVPPGWPLQAIKAVYAIEVFYYFAIFFIKMSLLFLYLRLASGRNAFYKGTIATMVLIVLQMTATVILEATQCVPMEKYWDPTTSGRCINITVFFYFTNVFTIITDMVIIALPVPTIWEVQRPRAQRIALLGTFLAGGLSTLASCIRLYSIARYTESHEPIRDAAPINTWSFIEINLGLLCASVPALRSLFLVARRPESAQLCMACISTSPKTSDKRSETAPSGQSMCAHDEEALRLGAQPPGSHIASPYGTRACVFQEQAQFEDHLAESGHKHTLCRVSDDSQRSATTVTTSDSSHAMSFDSLQIMAARAAVESSW